MSKLIPILSLTLLAGGHAAHGQSCQSNAAGTGVFTVVNGQVLDPNGKPFIARGINIMQGDQASAVDQVVATFPGINFIRLPIYKNNGAYADPASLAPLVQKLMSKGIVLEFEDHTANDNYPGGGSHGTVFTGQWLADELAWDAAMAKYYAGNPYVWLGTNNEPPMNPSVAALSTWQGQQYAAIRNTGNKNPILIEINGWADPASFASGYTASVYKPMKTVIGDVHFYGWLTGNNTDQSVINQFLSAAAATTQKNIVSADGIIPIIIGEFGDATDGQNIDPNGRQNVTAVLNSGMGFAAWAWGHGGNGGADGLNSGSGFGQQVAAAVANTATPGCVVASSTLPAIMNNAPSSAAPTPTSLQGGEGDPIITVTDTSQAGSPTYQIHIPAGSMPANGTSSQLTINDSTVQTKYVLADFQWTGLDTATAGGVTAQAGTPFVPAQSDTIVAEIKPNSGAITDQNGNVWAIASDGSIEENNQWTPGGGGTSALTVINGVTYGQDANSGQWFTYNPAGYWVPSQPPQ